MSLDDSLRARLVAIALDWETRFGVAPHITSAISEYDAALLVGHSEESYGSDCSGRTAVTRGTDFNCEGVRYQVKANRPSGKPGSPVTKVGKANNYDWDRLLWLLYDRHYKLQEAWEWDVETYRAAFDSQAHVRPPDMRRGKRIYPATVKE
ncbi:MAG: hypothetical protein ACR2NS_14070 [Gemmatimonadaceae bacterium]